MLYVVSVFFLMIRRPPRSTLDRSSAASDVYKRQVLSSVAPLGADYVAKYRKFMAGKQIDVYENEGKRSGAYVGGVYGCLLYTSPSPRDRTRSRMPSSA